jgi:hypothetical protein
MTVVLSEDLISISIELCQFQCQNMNGTNLMWRFVTYSAALGAVLPLVIYVTSLMPIVSDAWMRYSIILYVWPTFIMMMGFSGAPHDLHFWLALGISSLVNAAVYALVAYILCRLWRLFRGPNNRGLSQ